MVLPSAIHLEYDMFKDTGYEPPVMLWRRIEAIKAWHADPREDESTNPYLRCCGFSIEDLYNKMGEIKASRPHKRMDEHSLVEPQELELTGSDEMPDEPIDAPAAGFSSRNFADNDDDCCPTL